MRQLALPVRLRASSVFDGFYAGPNASILQQLRMLSPDERPPVVWLYGPQSAGKTHLLQAICAAAAKLNQVTSYLPLRDVVAIDAELLSDCESSAYICLDDVEAIAGHPAWERAIFRAYTEIEDRGGRLIVAAESPPASVAIKLRDLASRLAAGTVLRLQPLNDDDQIAALTLRAEQLGLELPAETAQFLLRRLPRDMATLCDALNLLDQASLASQRRLTVPFAKEVLEKLPPR